MFFLCVTLAKNNHWISFLMPKMAFLSHLEGRKKKAIFSLQALFHVLEVRGLVPPGAAKMLQVSGTSRSVGQLGIQLTGAIGYTLLQNASLGVGEGGEIIAHVACLRDIWHYCSFFFFVKKIQEKG